MPATRSGLRGRSGQQGALRVVPVAPQAQAGQGGGQGGAVHGAVPADEEDQGDEGPGAEGDEGPGADGEEYVAPHDQRMRQRLRGRSNGDGFQGLHQSSVTRALFSIKPLVEKDFEVWLQSVSVRFTVQGYSLCISAFATDAMAADADRTHYMQVPPEIMRITWTALRSSIGPETTAYATLASVEPGDSLGLLRILRANYERKSTPFRHQLLSDMASTALADFVDVRQYVAALDVFFTKLSKLNHVIADRDKLYHLLNGLTEEFKRGIMGNILAYESPHTGAPADYSKAVQLLQIWEDTNVSVKKPVRDTVMAVGMHKAASRRLPQAREGIKPTRTRSPCRTFSKTGQCRWGISVDGSMSRSLVLVRNLGSCLRAKG